MSSSPCKPLGRQIVLLLSLLFGLGSAHGQSTSLSLASGSALPGGALSLNLTLNAATGSVPSAMQWTLSYATSDIVSVNVSAGAALASAGKTIACNSGSGSLTCVASGMNASLIGNGVVAVVAVQLSATSGATVPLLMSNVVGSSADGSAMAISGTGGSISVQALAPVVSKLVCSPTSIASGATSTCTVTLSAAAPTGGSAVTISDNSSALTAPASVTVAAGASTANFTATAGSVTANQSVTVTAALNGSSATAAVTVTPMAVTVSKLTCSPSSVASGATSTCIVTLSAAAPTGGSAVTVSDNSSALTAPASVAVAAGASTANFTATAGSVTANQSVTITAALNGSSATAAVTVTPLAVTVSKLTCSPSSLASGATSTCTVTLSAVAPTGGSAVTVSDSSSALTTPASVTVAAGASTANFTATAGSVTANQSVTITAALNGSSATAAVTVTPLAVTVSKLTCSPSSLASGATSTCTVTLSAVAPTGGSAVTVSDSSSALTTPASVTVAAGASTANFTATAGSVTTNQSVTVTAALNGSSATAAVTVTPLAVTVSKLTCSPSSLASGATSTCTVTLSAVAPTGGSAVTVSDNSSALTTPASVTVAAGASTANFTATAGSVTANQSVTVTAALNGSSATAAVTVTPITLTVSSLACSPSSVVSGSSSSCIVTLSTAAPTGGSTVTISDNTSLLTTPASVTVAGSASSATFTATAGSITTNQSVTITAALNGSSASASLNLQSSTNTLAAAYAFDEGKGSTTIDDSGNGNTGQIHGATWTSKGKHGNALSFDGKSNYVDIGNGSSLRGTGSMTWSAWVYATANPADDGNIIAKSSWGSGLIGWQFKSTPDTGSQTFGILISADGNSYTERCSKTVRALKTWYHVAAVYNASAATLDIYVNGVLDDGVLYGTVPKAQYTPALNATIGKRADGFLFAGTIDDVRVYSRALSQTEIQNDMNTAVTTVSPGAITSALTPMSALRSAMAAPTADPSSTAGAVLSPRISALSCSPKVAHAGGQVTCELQLSENSGAPIQLASSAGQVKVPGMVSARSNQSSLTFKAAIDPLAKQQTAVLTATLGDSQAQASILVDAGSTPLLTALGRQIAKVGTPIDFVVNASDPGDLPVQLIARGIPKGATFDAGSGSFHWIPETSQTGKFEVTFTATNSASQSSSTVVPVEVDSGTPALDEQTLSCSPGAIAWLSGKWLAAAGTVLSDPTGGSMSLGGTKVEVNGEPVPVLFSSAAEVKFLCPALSAGTPLSVRVGSDLGVTGALAGTMLEATPSIVTLDGSGSGQGFVSIGGTKNLAMYRNFRIPAQPAQPGDEILIMATGLGSTAESAVGRVAVQISGIDAPVESVTPSGQAGLYTIQARVPSGVAFGDAIPTMVQVVTPTGHHFDSESVTLTVEPVRQ